MTSQARATKTSRSSSRRRDMAAALTAQVQQTRVILGGAADGLDERIEKLPLSTLTFVHQIRHILPPAVLESLGAGSAHPPTPAVVLAELQRRAAAGLEPAPQILAGLEELAASIAASGVEQPIVVYQKSRAYVVKVGHRRCLASLLAGEEDIPAVVKDPPSSPLILVRDQLVENLQRADLSPTERAEAMNEMRGQIRDRLGAGFVTNVRDEIIEDPTASGFITNVRDEIVEDPTAPGFVTNVRDEIVEDPTAPGFVTNVRHEITQSHFANLVQELGIGGPALERLKAAAKLDFSSGTASITERDMERISLAFLVALTGLSGNRVREMLRVGSVGLSSAEIHGLTESHLRHISRVPAAEQPQLAALIRERRLSQRATAAVVKLVQGGTAISAAVAEVQARRTKHTRVQPNGDQQGKVSPEDVRLEALTRQVKSGTAGLREFVMTERTAESDRPTPPALEQARQDVTAAIAELETLLPRLQALAIWGRQQPRRG